MSDHAIRDLLCEAAQLWARIQESETNAEAARVNAQISQALASVVRNVSAVLTELDKALEDRDVAAAMLVHSKLESLVPQNTDQMRGFISAAVGKGPFDLEGAEESLLTPDGHAETCGQ